MNHLGRITVKNPQAIMINFTDNPGAVKHAMKALMDKNPELGAEQDGIVIHINLPRLTREYRENLAKNAVKIFNEYKIKLDKASLIYMLNFEIFAPLHFKLES